MEECIQLEEVKSVTTVKRRKIGKILVILLAGSCVISVLGQEQIFENPLALKQRVDRNPAVCQNPVGKHRLMSENRTVESLAASVTAGAETFALRSEYTDEPKPEILSGADPHTILNFAVNIDGNFCPEASVTAGAETFALRSEYTDEPKPEILSGADPHTILNFAVNIDGNFCPESEMEIPSDSENTEGGGMIVIPENPIPDDSIAENPEAENSGTGNLEEHESSEDLFGNTGEEEGTGEITGESEAENIGAGENPEAENSGTGNLEEHESSEDLFGNTGEEEGTGEITGESEAENIGAGEKGEENIEDGSADSGSTGGESTEEEYGTDDPETGEVPEDNGADEPMTEEPTVPESPWMVDESGMLCSVSPELPGVEDGVLILPNEQFTGIRKGAFSNIQHTIYEIVLPSDLTVIEAGALTELTELEWIDAGGNPLFLSADGILFNAEMTEILAFPSGKTGAYIVPSSVEQIAEGTFENSRLERLDLWECKNIMFDKKIFGSGDGAGMMIAVPDGSVEYYQDIFSGYNVTVV